MTGLDIEHLSVAIGSQPLLRDVSLRLQSGEALALVGASGSGKTTLLRACLGLLPVGARVTGKVIWQGRNLLDMPPAELRRLRGRALSWIPQEPSAALDPRQTAVAHLAECGGTGALWAQVGLEAARHDGYPHEWSGGMQQRLLVAMALARFQPQGERLLLADEPTSALDPLHQAQLLELLDRLRRAMGFGLLLVTHDLAVAAAATERVCVLRAGQVVEEGATARVLTTPSHEYTASLVQAQPRWAGVV